MSEKRRRRARVIPYIYMLYGVTTIFMLIFSLILFVHNTYAATSTSITSIKGLPGVTSLSDPQILVKTSFSGADSDNLSITYTWKVDDANDNFSTPLGTYTTGTGLVSPYQYAITGLDNSKNYRIKVDFTDPGGSDSTVLVGVKTHNALIHNAVSTGSNEDLWTGGWGITGGQYGEFSCSTCHERKSGNIKRIRKDWSDPALPSVPAAQYNATVIFNSTSQFAKDDSADHTFTVNDARICEACHTVTSHHQGDMSQEDITESEVDHHSDKDCISCHKHSAGFGLKGGCSACHGGLLSGAIEKNIWPDSVSETTDSIDSADDSGEHLAHMTALAQLRYNYNIAELLDSASSLDEQKALCNYCHANPGSDADHADGDEAEVRFLEMDNSLDDGTFGYDYTDVSSATCSNVECHNNKQPDHWYANGSTSCLMCHTASLNSPNVDALTDPVSGLHLYNSAVAHVEGHDDDFHSSAGSCTSCHTETPSDAHINSVYNTPATTTFNFYNSSTHPTLTTFEVDLGTLGDDSDNTCAAECHSDQGYWERQWSTNAYFTFNSATFDTSNELPSGCDVCHGQFGKWAEGTSHAGTYQNTASMIGNTHNSVQDSGTPCEDCHVFPSSPNAKHENDLITLNYNATAVEPTYNSSHNIWVCQPCHIVEADKLPGHDESRVFPNSLAFSEELIKGQTAPSGACFSGAQGCHGDTEQRWWPAANTLQTGEAFHQGDPTYRYIGGVNYGYPNRAGAHVEHNMTIARLYAVDPDNPTKEEYNQTCKFCHPMSEDGSGNMIAKYHVDGKVDLYGGYNFPGADEKGIVSSGTPSNAGEWTQYDDGTDGDGYIYQLDDPTDPGKGVYPLDGDATYHQYLYNYNSATNVNHGTCQNVACHSNAPYTPNWYGDDQAPSAVDTLKAYTAATSFNASDYSHSHYAPVVLDDDCQDVSPGAVLLTWLAPGDNGAFDGTAYEYEVYYTTSGVITDANVGSATRVGGAPTVYRQDELQCMIVDGLAAGSNYYFAVRTKDQPKYVDTDDDGVFEKYIEDGKLSSVAATTSTTAAHGDDVAPVFWGINQAESHDTGGTVNLSWEAARDHTLPLTYLVYWSEYALKTHLANGGTMPTLTKPGQYDGGVYSFGYTEGSPPTAGGSDYYINVTTTPGMTYQVTGLGTGVLYNFLVRAEDGNDPVGDGTGIGNIDDNTVVSMGMANTMDQETTSTIMAVLDGNTGMTQTDPLNPTWGSTGSAVLANNGSFTVTDSADLDGAASRETWMQGISVDMTVTNGDRRLPQEFQVELGYDNGSFNAIGSPVTVGIGRKSSRVIKIGLSSIEGTVPANANLALKVTSTVPSSGSTANITFQWGSDPLKGQLMVTAQPINHQPSAPVFGSLSRGVGGYIDITWTPSNDGTPSDGGQTLHYDIFGSADNGATYPFVIGTGLTDADAATGVTWDTVGDGLDFRFDGSGVFNCKVKIEASDGYLYELTPGSGSWTSHRVVESSTIAVDNSEDDEPPAAVTINHVEPRPKQGAAYLHWIAVGNDGYNHGTRAAYYDIRFRKTADGELSSNWGDLDDSDGNVTYLADGEPVPGFAGTAEVFELLNMTPDTSYEVAVVTCDAGEDYIVGTGDDNCSGLSNVYTITSGQYYCGICHSTPPDEPDTKGIHREHGYTLEDCAKCHGDGTSPDGNDVTAYDGRHYDGVINIGWSNDSTGNQLTLVEIPPTTTSSVTVNQGAGVIYNDPDGSGGYNSGGPYTGTENTDSGRCSNFISANANGCHGPFTPQWAPDTSEPSPKEPACADCHGDDNSTLTRQTDPYGRVWDCNDGGDPSELVKASPPQANHGGTTEDDRYVGAHERHLNASFRFAKEDSCRLCHRDTFDLGLHADGNVDVLFDAIADQDEDTAATVDQTWWTDAANNVEIQGASCGSLNNMYCHDTGANWAEPGAKCNSCHGMASKSYTVGTGSSEIGHVMGQAGVVEECTYCHVAGHPQSADGINSGDSDALLINNNAAIGINYKSGGIHLKRSYPWGTYTTLAEICWGCHDQNNDGDLNDANDISEWGTNSSSATGSSNYNFGTLDQKQWTGAIWSSGYGQTSGDPFWYKRGYIQSTHTTDSSGGSLVSWDSANGRYNEAADSIDKIRCSNCHDVHDSNLAPGDTMSGRPYLRGTWKANPYEEDGAPYSKDYADNYPAYTFGAVPRGGAGYGELGGYYIDQNNVEPGTGDTTQDVAQYPTSGWTLDNSAGLCVLCHGSNVDEMDQKTGESLWLGTNGHSNSALGGDFSNGANIFDFSHGRPTPNFDTWGGAGRPKDTDHWPMLRADMAYLTQGEEASAGGGYRGLVSQAGMYSPSMRNQTTNPTYPLGFNYYDWGASVDADTTDNMYHQFSCSKCHNPHASRLPKLMITNCLDIRHNTWDDAKSSLQTKFTASELDDVDRNQRAAYYASAQNCHRFDPARTGSERGGWNKVTPWVKSNLDDSEHKGGSDTAYGDSSPTYHKFPTESTGW